MLERHRASRDVDRDIALADGIRHVDLMEGERVLNELIYEYERSLEGIEHAKLDLEARGWGRARGLKE